MRRQQGRSGGVQKPAPKKKRATYDQAFKLEVVKEALLRPPTNRIKPTCARFPGIEPCQVIAPLRIPLAIQAHRPAPVPQAAWACFSVQRWFWKALCVARAAEGAR